MKNFSILIVSALLLLHYCADAVTYDPKGLLIFIDDSEIKPLGYASGQLLNALLQKAGPIICSTSLLLVIDQTAQIKGTQADKLKKENPDLLFFDPDEWVLKKISNLLCLLIPKDYLKQKNMPLEYVEKYDPSTLSETELRLGLKVNHMELFKMNDITKMYLQGDRLKNKDYFIKAVQNQLTGQSDIFCVRSDYHKRNITVPAWSILISGHGYMNEQIVGIAIPEFRRFLDFLDQKILTRFLFYRSCYAAGLNNDLIFKDAQSALYKTYSYAIVTEAITEAVVTSRIIFVDIEPKMQVLAPHQNEKFSQFLGEVTQDEIHFEDAVQSITPLISSKYRENVPQIKFPGIEWFSILATRSDVVSIGQTLARTRQTPLDMIHFFKTNPQILLLYASHIPFKLVINTPRLATIISMIPGNVIHTFKEIASPLYSDHLLSWWSMEKKKDIADLLDCFMSIEKLRTDKIFYIQQLNLLKDVIINNIVIPGDPDKGIEDKFERYALFYDEKVLYIKQYGKKAVKADKSYKQLYETLLIKMQQALEKQSYLLTQDDIQKIAVLFADEEKREIARKKIEELLKKRKEQERIEKEEQQQHIPILRQALQKLEQTLEILAKTLRSNK